MPDSAHRLSTDTDDGLLLIISLLLLVIGGLQHTPPGREIEVAGER
jgi:hypothetical protein